MTRLMATTSLLLFAVSALAAPPALEITGGKTDQSNVVVSVPLPAGTDATVNVVELPDGHHVPAQVTAPALNSPIKTKTLTFVLPKLPAGGTVRVRPATLNYVKAPPMFRFVDKPGEYTDLLFDGRPVMRYINAPHDASTPDKHDITFKPFHHVFDPAKGDTLLTSGAYPFSDKSKQFPHHRGLFYGWNRISYGDKQADIWHGRKAEYTQHDKYSLEETGVVLGRHRSAISWHGTDGKVFASEQRELTAYQANGGTLIDFRSDMSTDHPKVRLDGDPQHAGFHFRAAQEVAKETAKQTYYLRPDGQGKPGETRNWDPKTKKGPTNLPWNAMSYVIGGKRYTTVRIDHPSNPKEARGSERDYGRFGDYFEYDLTPEKPLRVQYRVWIQEGEMTKEQCEAMQESFVNPPKVKVAP